MTKLLLSVLFTITLLLPQFVIAQDKDELDNYIQHLKDDQAGPRKETGFLTAGSDFLYAQEYFDAKNYSSAAGYYMDVVKKQKDNAFANYQLAVSLIKQNDPYKDQQAQEYLQNAFRINPSLKERYKRDVPADKATAINKVPANDNTAGTNNSNTPKTNNAGLEAYIDRLKKSRATGGAETAMNTPGQQALYGIENYEANEFSSAETDFKLTLAMEANNPYVNYLLAVAMTAQGKNADAKPYLQKAIAADPSLKNRYNKDVATASAKWQALVEKRKIKLAAPTKATYGGALVYCDYTCSQSVWNGPNVSPAYRSEYKGYFVLKPDGTYRWLNNGGTGKYKYDAATGTITWLSGYFKTVEAKSTLFQGNKESVQISVVFSDTYRWECGCKK